jgi:transcriptional regulator with XRE-family HTH domain
MFFTNTPFALRTARRVAEITQNDIAAEIGRSQMYVSRLERGGYARLTPEIAEKIAALVGVPSFILFKGERK